VQTVRHRDYFLPPIRFVSGRTDVMQGAIHLVVFAAFLFPALVP
jgi:Ca2+/H+ antiporter